MNKIKHMGLLIVAIIFCYPKYSHALVAITNGNYFAGFEDLVHPVSGSDFQLKIDRNYNSRSQYFGMFGYGWGSDFEAYMVPSVDGSVIIQESGGGAKTRFTPAKFSQETLNQAITKLVEAYKKTGAKDIEEFRNRITKDADKRESEALNLGIMPRPPVGTKLYSTERGGEKQIVAVTNDGYVRRYADGKEEFFTVLASVKDNGTDPVHARTLKGVYRVSKLVDPTKKAAIYYEYKDSCLALATDKKSQTIHFECDHAGKIVKATDRLNRSATYKYCADNQFTSHAKCSYHDLIQSKDAAGNVFSYEYDETHNLTAIVGSDGSREEVAYWPLRGLNEASSGAVKSVKKFEKDTSGKYIEKEKAEYSYWQDPREPKLHYKTEVKSGYSSGYESKAEYEYYEKRRNDGSAYRYKLVADLDGDKTTTVYNECCGQPLRIENKSGVTAFEYYPESGLLKERNTPSEVTKMEYHPKFHGKITKVVVADKRTNKVTSSQFTYDESNGNLKLAKTSDGKAVALQYDRAGKIIAMLDQKKRKISFKYNDQSKPVEIKQEGIGSILVHYDNSGNIREVKSQGGRDIAMSVTQAFQNLLEIIKPAGIQPI